MSVKTQKANMKSIHNLISQDLGYIHGPKESGPNGEKADFHRKSKAFLRALGNDLGFKEFKVTNNHGGIAVSGEITLMGMWDDDNGLYFQIDQPMPFNSFLYRSISHMKDYRGGYNQWLDCNLFKAQNYNEVLEMLLSLQKSAESVKRHAS